MKNRLLLAATGIALPVAALAYPLYWIGTQVHTPAGGGAAQFVWVYSGQGSNGAAWSNADATAASVTTAIGASFVDDQAGAPKDSAGQTCSTLVLTQNKNPTSIPRLNDTDGINTEGIFVSSNTDPIYQYMQGGVVAFAAPTGDSAGYVADCDTVYNAVDIPFATNGNGSAIDIETVAEQETSHCFGMHHTCQQVPGDGMPPCGGQPTTPEYANSVMYPFAAPGVIRLHPTTRDWDNLCQIYPTNGIGRPCDPQSLSTGTGFTTPDCTNGTSCACTSVGSICTVPSTGACPSGSTADCTGYCIPNFYPATLTQGQPVRTGANCGSSTCGVDGGSTGSVVAIGAPCCTSADCGSGGTCLNKNGISYCSVSCLGGSGCPVGSACFQAVLSPSDAYCLKTCTISSTGTCDPTSCRAGLTCQFTGSANQGGCWAPCAVTADCDPSTPPSQLCNASNGLCYASGGSPLCSGASFVQGPNACADAGSAGVDSGSIPPGPDASSGGRSDSGTPGSGSDGGDGGISTLGPGGCGCNSGEPIPSLAALAFAFAFMGRRRAAPRC